MDSFNQQFVTVDIGTANNNKVRFSGVELLRIVAMLLICIHHAVSTSARFINFDIYVVWVLTCAIGMVVGAYLLSVVYKATVHRLTALVSQKLCGLIASFIDVLYKNTADRKTNSDTDHNDEIEHSNEIEHKG